MSIFYFIQKSLKFTEKIVMVCLHVNTLGTTPLLMRWDSHRERDQKFSLFSLMSSALHCFGLGCSKLLHKLGLTYLHNFQKNTVQIFIMQYTIIIINLIFKCLQFFYVDDPKILKYPRPCFSKVRLAHLQKPEIRRVAPVTYHMKMGWVWGREEETQWYKLITWIFSNAKDSK